MCGSHKNLNYLLHRNEYIMISPRLSAEHLSLAVFPEKNTVLKLKLFSYNFWYGHISINKISKFINSCVGMGFIILILIKAVLK